MKLKDAGVKVILTSGDHYITTTSFSRRVNILDENSKTSLEIAQEKGINFEEAI